jgi:hypothetical protein
MTLENPNEQFISFTDSLPKDTLVLSADITTAELAEALAGLRFHHGSRCLVSLDKDVRDYLLRAIEAR